MPRGVVKRKALIAQLHEARHRRCFVLQGPAGCGKSTALVAWARTLEPMGFDIAWLTLSTQDNELTHLFDGLLATLSQVNAAIVTEAAQLAGRGQQPDALESLAVTLVRAIASHRRELLLVIDDLHHLNDARAIEVLQWILDYAPPNLHLALASRGAVPLSLARSRAQAMALELDLRDLRLSEEESLELLQTLVVDIPTRNARALHELADGWVLGLQLLAAEWNARSARGGEPPSVEAFQRVHVADADAFTVFFEREVLGRLTHAELEFLTSASICERFTASLSASLAGRPEAVGEAIALLVSLKHNNLFINCREAPGQESSYALNPLLRQTLQNRLLRRGQADQKRVHALAWQWFRDHDQFEDAVRHAVMAGEPAAAADLVERAAYRLRGQGNMRMLVRMMGQLPEDQVNARLGLRLWKIRLQIFTRDLEGAASSLQQLEHEYPGRQNPEHFATVLVKASLAVQRDQVHEFLSVLPQLLEGPARSDAVSMGARNNLLTWLYLQQGDYARARQVQMDATPLVLDGMPLLGGAVGSLQGRCLVGLTYALEGQMTQAERVYRDVMYEAERGGGPSHGPGLLAAALLAEVLYEIDDRQGVLALLESRVDILERISIPDAVLRVMTVMSRAHWLAGQRLEAFSYLERLEEYATRQGLKRLLAHSIGEQVRRHLQREEFDLARNGIQRLEAMQTMALEPVSGRSSVIGMLGAFSRLAWSMAKGDLDHAAEQIEMLSPVCEGRKERRTKVILLMRKAVVQWRMGDAAAERTLQEALHLGHRLGLLRALLDADAAVPKMLEQLMQEPGDPVLGFYLSRLRAASREPLPAGPVAAPKAREAADSAANFVEMLSEREIDVVRCLAQALPNKKIARSLGVTPETVKWHFKNIFSKLHVSSRDEALARLRDLGWSETDDTARGGPL
ncbi:LuxR C-terminal-related transcriptional regulator [Hydrogenophaga sp. 2FB]|uniref:LuxR C-terminal-related transcriptional regulator n=1 Tax=Hydrogenophaga sp. 2FB TaxID=2502187 RepID=UPI001BB2CD3A|nr:LuxR C-terminal-related transcriptional regulator [Hydrogenophaga sp. 2FB]